MINNERVFQRVMALLRSIDPDVTLCSILEPYLRQKLMPEDLCKEGRVLEEEGSTPAKAYYVVRGFVLIFGFDSKLNKFVMRIYRKNSIVAMNCFIRQKNSEFTVWACRDTLVWSISDEDMKGLYKLDAGMKEFVHHTAAEFNSMKERMRGNLLSLEEEDRVLSFYREFRGLLPAKGAPIKDEWIASYLGLMLYKLRRLRSGLIERGLFFLNI